MAKVFGWAAISEPGGPIEFGERPISHFSDEGKIGAAIWRMLDARVMRYNIGIILSEQPPPLVQGHSEDDDNNGKPRRWFNPRSSNLLFGQMMVVATYCAMHPPIQFWLVPNSTFTKFFVGKGRFPGGSDAKKAAVVQRCRELGYRVPGHNSAEAIAQLMYGENEIWPEAHSQRQEINLPLWLNEATSGRQASM